MRTPHKHTDLCRRDGPAADPESMNRLAPWRPMSTDQRPERQSDARQAAGIIFRTFLAGWTQDVLRLRQRGLLRPSPALMTPSAGARRD